MSITLVDDQESFEAALSFVDEYVASTSDVAVSTSSSNSNEDHPTTNETTEDTSLTLDGLPTSKELALVQKDAAAQEAPVSFAIGVKENAKPAKKRASKQAKKAKKPLTYNPNRAREQQRKELLYLREKVVEMEQELTALQSTRRVKVLTPDRLEREQQQEGEEISDFHAPSVWKEMAGHQLEQRLKSERENRRLKVVLEGQIKIGKSLEKLLEASQTTKPMESCVYGPQRTQRIHTSAPDRSGPDVFAELMAGVGQSYREVDDVFRANGLATMDLSFSDAQMREGPDGIFMEMFASKVFPFDVSATGTAAWKYFAKSMEHMPFRFLYQKDPQNLETTDDTIVESFGIELHANGTQADFLVKQILRRYVEEDRVVIVWRSYIDPVEFSGAPLRGAEFQEKGYLVVRRPQNMAPGFALLQTCYIVSPDTPVYSLSDEGAITGALTDFVLSGTAANIAAGHQMIENILFNEAMKTHSRV